jgi:hypothetical protein
LTAGGTPNIQDEVIPGKYFDSTDFVLATNHKPQSSHSNSQNSVNNAVNDSDVSTNAIAESNVENVNANIHYIDSGASTSVSVDPAGFSRSFFGGSFIGGGGVSKKKHDSDNTNPPSNDVPNSSDTPKNDPPVNTNPPVGNEPPSNDKPQDTPKSDPPVVNPPVNNNPPVVTIPPVIDPPVVVVPPQDDPPYYPPVDEPPHNEPVSVPEPGTIPLMLAGMVGVFLIHRRRRTA